MDREQLTWEALGRAGVDLATLAVVWVGVVMLRAVWPALWPLDLVAGPDPVLESLDVWGHLALVLLVAPASLAVLAARGDLRPPSPPTRRLTRLWVSSGLATGLVVVALFLLDVEWVSRPVVLGFAVGAAPALAVARWLRRSVLRRRAVFRHRVVVVGSVEDAEPLLARLAAHPEWGLAAVARLGPAGEGGVPWRGEATDLRRVLVAEAASEVVLVGSAPAAEDLRSIAAACDELGVRLSLDANFLGLRVGRAELRDLDGYGVVSFASTSARGLELALKRTIDVVGAVIGLVVLGPLIGLLALAVRLHDGGPAFYTQTRAGLHGRGFRMLKLRTMVVDADQQRPGLADRNEADGHAFKLRADPRVTRLGGWLRRSSLDELPQLVNVLRGDMSLVGPRPPLPSEVAEYAPWQLRRLSMRPGITGLWQVSGRSALPFDRWMALDLEYIDRWSLGLDVLLLLRTLPAVVSGRGAW